MSKTATSRTSASSVLGGGYIPTLSSLQSGSRPVLPIGGVMSQRSEILQHMLNGGTVTRLTAFTMFGCSELSSRIGEIESDGWPIRHDPIEVEARNGKMKHVTEYSLDETKPWPVKTGLEQMGF